MTKIQPSRYASLSRDELAILVPELLLIGCLIDRASLVWCVKDLGRETMTEIAIDEWASASPIYSKRMQRALGFEGDDVATIFKGFQLDIGSPPQYMDFRFTIRDRNYGEFRVEHCGGLADFEPLGEDFVVGMCHTVEDPTFDATAIATNPRAQLRPIHRPPRAPEARDHAPCSWTAIIDESHPIPEPHPALDVIARKRVAGWNLEAVDRSDTGYADYSGPLMSDLDFTRFSKSALTRMADEVCIQMHLLSLSFSHSVTRHAGPEVASQIRTQALIGLSGVAAKRIHAALDLPGGIVGVARVIELHPMFNPAGYVTAAVRGDELVVGASPAHEDSAWISLCGPAEPRPMQAIVASIDPHLDVDIVGDDTNWVASIVRRDEPADVMPEVSIAEISSGARFEFSRRRSIPLTVL